MQLICLDFESYFDRKYSLSRLTVEDYVRHPLFKVFCVGIKVNGGETRWYGGDDVEPALKAIDWSNNAVLAHNAQFDCSILHWIYGIKPKFIFDTVSMANAVFPWMSSSLARLAKHYELKDKGTELVNTCGKRDLTQAEMKALGEYCCHDVDLTWEIFQRLKVDFPLSELKLIDMTVRMFTEPEIEIDQQVLLEEYKRELRSKKAFMKRAGTDKKTLMSNDKFAVALQELGVDPPTKISARTGKVAWAFSKSDEDFKLLLDHPDERVRWLVAARLGVKSTIKETRTKRFYKIGKRGKFPVALIYYGAHSGRFSGGGKCLVEATEIIVLRSDSVCHIPLPELLPDDLVWDGEEFVSHGGLVYQGVQEVIYHDGITGTADHKVYVEEEDDPVSLSEAKERNYTLQVARLPGQNENVRVGYGRGVFCDPWEAW